MLFKRTTLKMFYACVGLPTLNCHLKTDIFPDCDIIEDFSYCFITKISTDIIIGGVFFTGPPPKSSKYNKVNLG